MLSSFDHGDRNAGEEREMMSGLDGSRDRAPALRSDVPISPARETTCSVLQGGRIVVCSENQSAITQYFQTKLVVVEVRNGESQEEAWRRHLAENPESAGAQVKIFHYPKPSPLKKKGEIRSQFPLVSAGKNTS
jgi:hypothetical protein